MGTHVVGGCTSASKDAGWLADKGLHPQPKRTACNSTSKTAPSAPEKGPMTSLRAASRSRCSASAPSLRATSHSRRAMRTCRRQSAGWG